METRKVNRSYLNAAQRPLQGGLRVIKPRSKYQGLAGEYQKKLNEANAANEARYQQILGGYDALHGRVTGDLANVGAMERKDINRQYNSMGADVYQKLVNRGFGNSSLLATMRMGTERERSDAMARSYERAAQMRANADMQITQGKLGAIERRTDLAPDPQQLINLSQGLGRSGYGQRPMYGQPIGMNPGQLMQGYQAQLMQHLGGMPMAGRQYGRSDQSLSRIARARSIRRSRYGYSSVPSSTAKAVKGASTASAAARAAMLAVRGVSS